MGDLGLALKDQVEALIDDINLLSQATVNSTTLSEGDFGGYTSGTATIDSATVINAIPSNYVITRTGLQIYGDLEDGDLRILVKEGVVIDSNDDTIIFNNDTFRVREIKPIFFNEEIIAKAIVLTKDL